MKKLNGVWLNLTKSFTRGKGCIILRLDRGRISLLMVNWKPWSALWCEVPKRIAGQADGSPWLVQEEKRVGLSHMGRLQRGGLGDPMRFADSPSRMQSHLLRMQRGGKSPWLGDTWFLSLSPSLHGAFEGFFLLPRMLFSRTFPWLVTLWHLDLSLNVFSSERVSVTSKSTITTPFSHSRIPLDLSEEPLLWDI